MPDRAYSFGVVLALVDDIPRQLLSSKRR